MELKPEQLVAQLGLDQAAPSPLRPAYLIAGPEPLRVLEAADAVRAAARRAGHRRARSVRSRRQPARTRLEWHCRPASARRACSPAGAWSKCACPAASRARKAPKIISDFCADPPHGRDPAGHRRRVEQAARRQVERGDRPHRPDRRSPGRSSRTNCRTGSSDACAQRGLRADRDAVQNLADRVEGNLLAAAQEIDKLALLSDGQTLDSAQDDRTGRRCRALRRVPPGRCGDERAGRAGVAHARRPARRRRSGAGAARHGGDGTAARGRAGARAGARRQSRRRIQGAAHLGFEAADVPAGAAAPCRRRAGMRFVAEAGTRRPHRQGPRARRRRAGRCLARAGAAAAGGRRTARGPAAGRPAHERRKRMQA